MSFSNVAVAMLTMIWITGCGKDTSSPSAKAQEAQDPCAAHPQGQPPLVQYCQPGGMFADCTSAPCTKGTTGVWNCACKVYPNNGTVTDAAVGCLETKNTALQSRYQPVKTLGLCPGQNQKGQITWAWCLGKKCDWAKSGATTTCYCGETNSKDQHSFQYLLVTPLTAANCSDGGVYSSATLAQIFSATSMLRCHDNKELDPKVSWVVTGPTSE
jgi:hypothetical protein